jgi:hypothetical protein
MESSNINHEDKDNEGNINIPLATSSLERKMLEYIAAQTQVLQAMAQTMVKIHQSITEQASLPKAHNTVTNDNHQNMTPPPFDKEELPGMQTQVLQGRMQPSITYFRNEMAKDKILIGLVKRQVTEAWNKSRKKKKHEALKLRMVKQHEDYKAPDMCPGGEHDALSCPQKEASLMTAKARQHNPIDINKQRMLSTQNPTQEEGSQAEGRTQTLNLDDWIITCKEYKPGRRKRSNKQNRRTRREEKLSHLGAGNGIEPGSDKSQPKIVRPVYVTPIKKNPDAQVDLPRTMMEQSEKWRNHKDGRVDKL